MHDSRPAGVDARRDPPDFLWRWVGPGAVAAGFSLLSPPGDVLVLAAHAAVLVFIAFVMGMAIDEWHATARRRPHLFRRMVGGAVTGIFVGAPYHLFFLGVATTIVPMNPDEFGFIAAILTLLSAFSGAMLSTWIDVEAQEDGALRTVQTAWCVCSVASTLLVLIAQFVAQAIGTLGIGTFAELGMSWTAAGVGFTAAFLWFMPVAVVQALGIWCWMRGRERWRLLMRAAERVLADGGDEATA